MKLSAVLLVQNQILLNKYNYNLYRPIGTITETIDRLQELQVDEIVILNKGHSLVSLENALGPKFLRPQIGRLVPIRDKFR